MIKDVVFAARSCRRFRHEERVSPDVLASIIDAARMVPSAGNLQKLKFTPIDDAQQCEALFPALRWAGYLSEWPGPEPNERPAAYIIIWQDLNLGSINEVDLGIAAQTINLVARADFGLGCCMIGAFDRKALHAAVLPQENHLEPALVVAIGSPVETVVVDDIADDNVRYWRDAEGCHHVPKRTLGEVLVK